ncbi:uncharacterized protein PHA67_015990 [Liasis olivaceus]
MYCQWSDLTTAGIFITSSTNFDLQFEDENLELLLPDKRVLENIRGLEFFSVANLRMDKLVHSSDRLYKCPECEKGFIHKVDLWRHTLQNVHKIEQSKTDISIHIGEKLYSCTYCAQDFTESGSLRRHECIHQIKHHSVTGDFTRQGERQYC